MKPERQLVWLDLCSGLGGASQPAKDRGWRVIRVDIDPRFKPDIVADVRSLPFRPVRRVPCDIEACNCDSLHKIPSSIERIDVLWASPPCTEFSKFGLRCFFPNPKEPDLSILHAVRQVIDDFKPTFWMVENVWAARPWFTKVFGPVRNRIPGHALWSNMQILLPNIAPHKGSFHDAHTSGKRWGPIAHKHDPTEWFRKQGKSRVGTRHNGMEASAAALIPPEIGEAICIAVERWNET